MPILSFLKLFVINFLDASSGLLNKLAQQTKGLFNAKQVYSNWAQVFQATLSMRVGLEFRSILFTSMSSKNKNKHSSQPRCANFISFS